MGYRTDGDEKAFYEWELRRWASEMPSNPNTYDRQASSDEQAYYDYNLKRWVQKKPVGPDPYAKDRR
jgi:hypothetical protein